MPPINKSYISLYNMLKGSAERSQTREQTKLSRQQLRNPEKYGNWDNSLETGYSNKKEGDREAEQKATGGAATNSWLSSGVRESNREAGADPDKTNRQQQRYAKKGDRHLSDVLENLAAAIQKQKANKVARIDNRQDWLRNHAYWGGNPEKESGLNRLLNDHLVSKERKLTDKYDLKGVNPSKRHRDHTIHVPRNITRGGRSFKGF
jgi:hypothetical protein